MAHQDSSVADPFLVVECGLLPEFLKGVAWGLTWPALKVSSHLGNLPELGAFFFYPLAFLTGDLSSSSHPDNSFSPKSLILVSRAWGQGLKWSVCGQRQAQSLSAATSPSRISWCLNIAQQNAHQCQDQPAWLADPKRRFRDAEAKIKL